MVRATVNSIFFYSHFSIWLLKIPWQSCTKFDLYGSCWNVKNRGSQALASSRVLWQNYCMDTFLFMCIPILRKNDGEVWPLTISHLGSIRRLIPHVASRTMRCTLLLDLWRCNYGLFFCLWCVIRYPYF